LVPAEGEAADGAAAVDVDDDGEALEAGVAGSGPDDEAVLRHDLTSGVNVLQAGLPVG
jgi:hypothetical protein